MDNKDYSQNIVIRNYRPEDYASVKLILEEGGLFDPGWDAEEKLIKRIEEKRDSIIVACIEDIVVGNIFLVDDFFPFVFHLAVKKEFRKKGIGKKLVEESAKRLKQHGHDEIALLADDENEELKLWYKNQGFTLSKSYRGIWKKI